jgi:hypothetical protein
MNKFWLGVPWAILFITTAALMGVLVGRYLPEPNVNCHDFICGGPP